MTSLFMHDTYLSPLQLKFWHARGHVEGMGIIQMLRLEQNFMRIMEFLKFSAKTIILHTIPNDFTKP